jgi:hypothetical protein
MILDIEMTITFVTSFFDIGRTTDAPLQKFTNYFAWIEQLLELPINIYFFTTPELHAQIKYTPRANLIWKLIPDVPYYDHLHTIRESWKNYQTGNPTKDTPEFAAITHAKFIFLSRAIAENPFGDTHYGWIDAGLLKIATNPEQLPLLIPSDRIRCLLLNYIGADEVRDPHFIDRCQYKIAAGLIVGSRELMRVLCLRMIAEAEQHLYEKKFGLEQEYLAIMYRRHPEIFDPYYGSFSDLIVNFNQLTRNDYIANTVFQDALRHNDRDDAIRVAHYLIKSTAIPATQKQFMERFIMTSKN